MSTICLTSYGLQARDHWRQFRPKMVAELEAQGKLEEALYEAQEMTSDEMIDMTRKLRRQGLTAQQAYAQAWEMIREKYILLPPEESDGD